MASGFAMGSLLTPSYVNIQIPFLRRVAAAHSLHHIDKFNGVPFGLFLGPQELAAVGGTQDLDRQVARQLAIERERAAAASTASKKQ